MGKFADAEKMPKDMTQVWLRDLFTTNIQNFLKVFFPKLHQQCTHSFTQIAPKTISRFTLSLNDGMNIGLKTKRNGEDVIIFIHVIMSKISYFELVERIQYTKQSLQKHFYHPTIPIVVDLKENTLIDEIDEESDILTVQIMKSEIDNYLSNGNIVALAILNKYIFNENEREKYCFDIFRKVVQMQADLREKHSLYQFFLT